MEREGLGWCQPGGDGATDVVWCGVVEQLMMIDLRSGEDGSHSTDEKRRGQERKKEEGRRGDKGEQEKEGGRGMTRASVLSGVFCLIRYEYDISSFCSMMSMYIVCTSSSLEVPIRYLTRHPDKIRI
jgi:hypothetical protein